jgi:hypothetical protein
MPTVAVVGLSQILKFIDITKPRLLQRRTHFIEVQSEYTGRQFLPFRVFICLPLLSRSKGICYVGGGDDYDAVIVGHNNVAGANRHSGANDRDINAAERRFYRTLCRYGPRPNRKTNLLEDGDVAGTGINHQAAHTTRL